MLNILQKKKQWKLDIFLKPSDMVKLIRLPENLNLSVWKTKCFLNQCWLLCVGFICKCIFESASEIQPTSFQIKFISFYYYKSIDIGHLSLQSLSVLTSSLNRSQLTFSLFGMHLFSKVSLFEIGQELIHGHFIKMGCFRRSFLNLPSKIAHFEEFSLNQLQGSSIIFHWLPVVLF